MGTHKQSNKYLYSLVDNKRTQQAPIKIGKIINSLFTHQHNQERSSIYMELVEYFLCRTQDTVNNLGSKMENFAFWHYSGPGYCGEIMQITDLFWPDFLSYSHRMISTLLPENIQEIKQLQPTKLDNESSGGKENLQFVTI